MGRPHDAMSTWHCACSSALACSSRSRPTAHVAQPKGGTTMSETQGTNRRDLLKTAIYVSPALLTCPVTPAAARSGSERNDDHPKKKKKHHDKDKHDYDDKKSKGKWGHGGGKDRD